MHGNGHVGFQPLDLAKKYVHLKTSLFRDCLIDQYANFLRIG